MIDVQRKTVSIRFDFFLFIVKYLVGYFKNVLFLLFEKINNNILLLFFLKLLLYLL